MATQPTLMQANGFFQSRRWRIIKENLTAYTLLAPAGLLIFLFGLFPVAFAFFVSLHRWRYFPDNYLGLDNYQTAIGNLGYILFFWLAIAAFIGGIVFIRRAIGSTRATEDSRAWLFILPGFVSALAMLVLIDWVFKLMPAVMDIPRQIRGQETTLDLFMNKLNESIILPHVLEAGNLMLLAIIAAIVLTAFMLNRLKIKNNSAIVARWIFAFILIAGSYFLMQLTLVEVESAISVARESGEELPFWSQLIFITSGVVLIGAAYKIFQRGIKMVDDKRFIFLVFAGLSLAVGGYIIMAELPAAVADSDKDFLTSFSVTVLYALGTVPVQLAIGLTLAYLLFQPIRFRAFFRMMYFIPYITPFVATSIVFRIIFNATESAPANRLIGLVGIEPQRWLLERSTIGELLGLPEFLTGPSMALLVIMIYSTWTYIGYDAVIFLAGLGNISGELYEAARIDGATGWRIFRHITLPLLSPTTFFLTLVAIIGTFQAFTQIWILRANAVGNVVNTSSVFIFDELNNTNRYGYASSLAFVLFLVILLLTLFQNRIMGRRVFYG